MSVIVTQLAFCNTGDLGLIPGLGRSLEKGKATHSSVLAWRIPWTSLWVAKSRTWLNDFHLSHPAWDFITAALANEYIESCAKTQRWGPWGARGALTGPGLSKWHRGSSCLGWLTLGGWPGHSWMPSWTVTELPNQTGVSQRACGGHGRLRLKCKEGTAARRKATARGQTTRALSETAERALLQAPQAAFQVQRQTSLSLTVSSAGSPLLRLPFLFFFKSLYIFYLFILWW